MKRLLLLTSVVGTLLGAAPLPDPVEDVAQALARGTVAETHGNGKAMLEAARSLEALGARAGDGAVNASKRWRELALAAGVKDRKPPFRGRALGPAYRDGMLKPRTAMSTEQVFLAGQPAEIALVPEPSRPLAISVSTADGKNICSRVANAPRTKCSWMPVFTSRVQIRIVNEGEAPARYYLVSN